MPLQYRLVLRRNMQKDAPAGSKRYYAQARTTGVSEIRELCEMIRERSTVSSADVKAVLDSLVFVMRKELSQGRIVRLRDFGSFRMTFGSKGVENEEDFSSQIINRPKYTFIPGPELKEQALTMKFEKYVPEKETIIIDEPCPLPHD